MRQWGLRRTATHSVQNTARLGQDFALRSWPGSRIIRSVYLDVSADARVLWAGLQGLTPPRSQDPAHHAIILSLATTGENDERAADL